jgi:uncharacterized protein
MYDTSVPFILKGLDALDALLTKAEAHCAAKKIDPQAILGFRLFPDMFAFTKQVQLVTDFAKGCGARLSGIPVPSFADEEKTFEELHARIAKTKSFFNGIDKSAFKDAATRPVTLKVAGKEMTLPGDQYYGTYFLPNFYFHLATAYNILRHNGVEIGKGDFVGR